MNKVTPFLMFNDQLEAAIAFYTATFPDSEVRNVARTGKDGPISSAEFVVGGQRFMGYNGGPYFSFSEFDFCSFFRPKNWPREKSEPPAQWLGLHIHPHAQRGSPWIFYLDSSGSCKDWGP